MKKFFYSMIMVAFVAISLVACEAEFKSDFLDRLPGKWVLANVYPDDAAKYVTVGDVFTFSKDGKAEIDNSLVASFENFRWSYTADLENGQSEFGVLADRKVVGESSANAVYLLFGIVASSSENYIKLQYTDDKYITYTYELRRQQ